ncbi:arylalcohol dehydrogenase [Auriscalpium vulgare]|uniref:Arylalcohol dehydrogenase n=1 Tax=Auriscalpium vulgare TaxID=40419 RepID=A0ACB8RKZ3_9AGAM|nr:arylalcohol dehydrogenase [Auriscalpium vulgare]
MSLPEAPTPLGRYRLLSPRASIRVSPIALGAMSIGDKWDKMGKMDKEASFKLLDAYYDAGGNFIDTANAYHDGASEEFIGEWMEQRGIRDQIVVATKYAASWKRNDTSIAQKVHYVGSGAKSQHISVAASLKKLRTDYIDILYVHWWDWETSVEELMNSLNSLVASGKVLYLDTPAYVVAKANQYARDHGKTQFSIYEGEWNVMRRSFERDILPMARDEGMAIAPWNVLAAGRLRTDAEDEARQAAGDEGRTGFSTDGKWQRTEEEIKMSHALEKVANEIGATSIQAVAIAYVMSKAPYVFPIIGGRKVENLQKNIEALQISLTQEQIDYLESILPFDAGFPTWLIGNGTKPNGQLTAAAPMDKWPTLAPIKPFVRG